MKRLSALLTALVPILVVASVPVFFFALDEASAAKKEQRFSVFCELAHQSREDPSLLPVGTDADHVHNFFGSTGIKNFPSGPLPSDGMRAVPTSCEFKGDTASYWVPLFERNNGEVVAPTQVLVYYRHTGSGPVVPHPPDFQMKSFDVEWGCVDSDNFSRPPNCSDRDIRMRVIFKPVDVNGVPTPRIAMNVRYDTQNGQGGHVLGGMSGEHGNFFNTWDQPQYEKLINTCLVQSSVNAMTQAEWENTCPKVQGGVQASPSPSPSPSPTPITPEEKLAQIEACINKDVTPRKKVICVEKALALE